MQTVARSGGPSFASAGRGTVRRDAPLESLPRTVFSELADGADGRDGSNIPFSGMQKIRMVRVRARPSRSNEMSTPTLRRKVAARRSRPESARAVAGQVLARRTVSPTSSERAPRRS